MIYSCHTSTTNIKYLGDGGSQRTVDYEIIGPEGNLAALEEDQLDIRRDRQVLGEIPIGRNYKGFLGGAYRIFRRRERRVSEGIGAEPSVGIVQQIIEGVPFRPRGRPVARLVEVLIAGLASGPHQRGGQRERRQPGNQSPEKPPHNSSLKTILPSLRTGLYGNRKSESLRTSLMSSGAFVSSNAKKNGNLFRPTSCHQSLRLS